MDIGSISKTRKNKCAHRNKWKYRQLAGIYKNIRHRCYDPKYKSYRFYGQRGITMCDEWLTDNGMTFQDWMLEHGYIPGLSLDRVDPTKGYSPDNCRICTIHENLSENKRSIKLYTVGKYTYSASQWARICGYNVHWLSNKRDVKRTSPYRRLLNRLWEINWFFKNMSKPLTDEEIDEKYKEFLREEGEIYD